MGGSDHLGEFEHLVLLAVLQLGEGAYGAAVRNELRERAGRAVSYGAVYATLRRMDDKGLVTSRWDTSSGRPRKYFGVTDEGLSALRQAREQIARMSLGLEGRGLGDVGLAGSDS